MVKFKKIEKEYFLQKILPTICFLLTAFWLGRMYADAVIQAREEKKAREVAPVTEMTNVSQSHVREYAPTDYALRTWGLLFSENWGLGFGKEGSCPTGNATAEELAKYDAYYVGDTSKKTIYLTFDCGYENGNTEAILEALKKHDAKATFFVVGHYLSSSPDIVKKMLEDGHTVGNHTYHHPDMSKMRDQVSFDKEVESVRELFRKTTGQEMSMYYRPPQGKYSTANLKMAQNAGYKTFFWSLAYVDWKVNEQPGREEALKKLTGRVHPGAVVLLHNTSSTNAEILDELLTKWEEMGYTFGTLEEFTNESKETS